MSVALRSILPVESTFIFQVKHVCLENQTVLVYHAGDCDSALVKGNALTAQTRKQQAAAFAAEFPSEAHMRQLQLDVLTRAAEGMEFIHQFKCVRQEWHVNIDSFVCAGH